MTIISKQVHMMTQGPSIHRQQSLYEKLRGKLGSDIVAIMKEENCTIEMLAEKLRMGKDETREWIWDRDFKLSELIWLLDFLNSEFYPLIRQEKLRRKLK